MADRRIKLPGVGERRRRDLEAVDHELAGGIRRFEVLLDLIGIPPFADRDRRKTLIEMHGVRNLIVHRALIADRKFLDGCPWITLEAGERFIVDRDTFHRYCDAVLAFVAHVRESIVSERRIRNQAAARGQDVSEELTENASGGV